MSVALRKRKRESGKTYVYLDIYAHGSRKTELLRILTGDKFQDKETMKECQEVRNQRERDLFAGEHGVTRASKRKANFIKYCEQLGEQRAAPNTRSQWLYATKHLREYAGEGCVFANLDEQFFKGFRDFLLKTKKLGPGSAGAYLAKIKTAIHSAIDEGIIPLDPSAKVKIRKPDRLPVHLSLEEVQKLSETACPNDQTKAAFLFSCFTGLRAGDVRKLTWDKIRDGYLEFSQEKTSEAVRLPLSEEALRILDDQKNAKPSPNLHGTLPQGTVFFMPSHGVTNKQLLIWARAAGIDKPISFHKSRHSFATLSLSSGIDLYTVSKLLGHKSLAATQIYAQVVDKKKKEAVGMLPTLKHG
jgi:integrase